MSKKIFIAALLVSILLIGCSKSKDVKNDKSTEIVNETVKVALITSSGGLGDRSFNDAAFEGLQRAEVEYGVEIKVIEPQGISDYQQSLKLISSAGYNLIITVGNDWSDALSVIAPNFPNTKYAAINLKISLDNLQVAKFADHEGSFLAGSLAGLMTKTNKIGFIGGMDVPAITRFYVGYEEGAKYVNSDVEVIPTYVGSFADPFKGKEFALQLIGGDCDIIFHAAGKTGEGLFDAIKTTEDVYAIGVDRDQDSIVEGKVLTSMIKSVDAAVYDMVGSFEEGTFKTGTVYYGLKEKGVGLSDMKYTKNLISEDILNKLDVINSKIIDGEIVVTDVFSK
jgi:basic membrane protein A